MYYAGAGSLPTRPLLTLIDPNLLHVAFNTGLPQAQDKEVAGPSSSKRPRKDRVANWLIPKTLVLIEAKRKQHEIEKNTPDK